MFIRILTLTTALFAMTAMAQIQEVAGKGHIDWGKKTVSARGIGAPNPNMPEVTARPMAIQAARMDALRNALEVVKGIHITSSTTVQNYMVSSDLIQRRVSGYISTYTEKEPRYMADKTVEIEVSIPIEETFMDALLPTNTGSLATREVRRSVAQGAPSKAFTGLIIDARGLGAVPALAPRIVDEAGKEVYGSAYVSREFAVKWGMAGYARDPVQAAEVHKDRLGSNPGVIKALRATGASRCDLVLSDADARSVREAAQSMSFLSDCRVIIILD
jgi:hypothetical protein